MNIINLQDIKTFPQELVKKLSVHDKEFQGKKFLEDLQEDHSIAYLIQEMNNYCLANKIIGFHYTRAIPKSILKKGLLIRSGKEIRSDFLKQHNSLFTQQELVAMKKSWSSNFWQDQKDCRDHRVYFNLTLTELPYSGAKDLLGNYGGEQVYFCIDELEGVRDKIKNIGKPLVVECVLNPNEIITFDQNSFGKVAISTYHRFKNPKAHTVDRDIYQEKHVLPENIKLYEVLDNYKLIPIDQE